VNKNELTNQSGCYTQYHNTTTFEIIKLDEGQQIDDKYPYTLGSITWEIRSAYDPWLLSEILTEDTSNFGMSATELKMLGFGLLF
jgi:hypothetical protein